jgi:TRAP-type C4-dicarboxylate transport system substrate-binding protein
MGVNVTVDRLRRKLFKMASAGVTALAAPPLFAQSSPTTLTVASWAGPNHAINAAGWKRLAGLVEQKSGGSLRLDVTFPPVNPRVMFDRVQEGISDMAWGFNGYTPGRFVSYQIVELPGLGAGAEAASVAYWRTHEKYLAKANEYAGLKLLTLFAQPPSVLHTRKQVNSLADMRGMKIRVGGGVQADVASRLGMVGVQAPVSEAYQMIKDGIVDGTFFPAETALSFKLNEVAKHQLALRDGLFGAAYFVVMNSDKYAALSPAHKRVIDELSGEPMAALFGKAWDDAETAAIATLKPTAEGGYRIAPEPLSRQIGDLFRPIDESFVQSAAKKGVDGKEALAFLRSEARKPLVSR